MADTTTIDLDEATRAQAIQALAELDFVEGSAFQVLGDQIIPLLTRELFLAVDRHGGVAGARYVLDAIAQGHILGAGYVVGPFGCIYGSLLLSQVPQRHPFEVVDAATIYGIAIQASFDASRAADNVLDEVRKWLPEWTAILTPLETLLYEAHTDKGDTDKNNTALAFVKAILTHYIALHEAA